MKHIKRTKNYTAFLANTTGEGRVHPSDMARGKLAIVPESMKFEEPEQETDARQPVARSIVSDGGVFDAGLRGRMK